MKYIWFQLPQAVNVSLWTELLDQQNKKMLVLFSDPLTSFNLNKAIVPMSQKWYMIFNRGGMKSLFAKSHKSPDLATMTKNQVQVLNATR